MSLASEVDNLNNLVESSLESKNEDLRLKWISCSDITDIEPTPTNGIYYASRRHKETMHLLLGSSEECTPALVSEFARIYSLPTHKYNNVDNNFKRYSKWLDNRNRLINGFTKYEDKFYMVADKFFYRCYSRYGFCTACGTLRSSPVWCICGHKQVSDGWTSNNKLLDEFIKKSQLQTNSANDAYLEWIPFDCISKEYGYQRLRGPPTYAYVTLIPLEITDETHDLYYAEVNYLLMRHVY